MYTFYLYMAIISRLFCATDIQTFSYTAQQSLTIYNSHLKEDNKEPVIIILGNGLKEEIVYAAIARNIPVVAVHYATICDVNNALRWIKQNGREYGLSPDKLILCGAGEGGTMAALAATTGSYIKGVTSQIEFGPENAAVKAQTSEQNYQNTISSMNPYNGKILGTIAFYAPLEFNGLTVSNFITPYTPPFFLIYGSNDPIVPLHNAEFFYHILMTNLCPPGTTDCKTQMVVLHGEGHGGSGFATPDILRSCFNFMTACTPK